MKSALKPDSDNNQSYFYKVGLLFSALGHLILAVICIVVLEQRRAEASSAQEVFTVTLEGGAALGGIAQVPKDLQKQKPPKGKPQGETASQKDVEPKAEPKQVKSEPVPEPTKQTVQEPTKPMPEGVSSITEEELHLRKVAEEQKKKELEKKEQEKKEEQAKQEKEKKKEEELKQREKLEKLEKEKKEKEAEDKKRVEEEKKVKEEQTRKSQVDKEFDSLLTRTRERYDGESYDAGGEGFGAAKLGGEGTGGGVLQSLEFVAYINALEQHIKQGWRWLPQQERYVVKVLVRIAQDGTVQDAVVQGSSGNAQFDDSAIRAVRKASPVPVPPEKLYPQLREVRITFDSHK